MALLYNIVYFTNGLMILLALVVIGFSGYGIYQFESAESSLFSTSTYIYLMVAGVFTIAAASLACCGIKNPRSHSGLLFLYYNLVLVILLLNGVGIYVFVTIFDTVQESTSTGTVSNAVQNYAAREVQDFILSTYTTCCTSSVANCPTTEANASVPSNCTLALTCPPDAANGGLGQGCYTSAQSIPPFTIGASICDFLANDVSPAIVGPADSGACGGGDPVAYVNAVFAWLNSNYLTVLVPWGIMVSLLFLNFLGACYYNLSPRYERGSPPVETLSV